MTNAGPVLAANSRRRTAVAVVLIAAAGMAIRAYHLGARSIWFDEAFSWRLTTFSWGEMLERASRDNNPPLYYILLKAWSTAFGESAVALRSLSVLMGCVTICCAYLFCVEAFERFSPPAGTSRRPAAGGHEIGLMAAALVAVSVYQIRWAWEARMYTLGAALTVLSGIEN